MAPILRICSSTGYESGKNGKPCVPAHRGQPRAQCVVTYRAATPPTMRPGRRHSRICTDRRCRVPGSLRFPCGATGSRVGCGGVARCGQRRDTEEVAVSQRRWFTPPGVSAPTPPNSERHEMPSIGGRQPPHTTGPNTAGLTVEPLVFVTMLCGKVVHPLRPRLSAAGLQRRRHPCPPINDSHSLWTGSRDRVKVCSQPQSLASVTAFIQLKEFGMLLTVRMDRNPSAARRGFVMRAGVMAGAVSVFAAGADSFGAGSTSASPYMSPSRVGQVQPRNLPLGSGRADVFAADDPADPGSPCAAAHPCGDNDQGSFVNPFFPTPYNPILDPGNPADPDFPWAPAPPPPAPAPVMPAPAPPPPAPAPVK